MMENNIHIGLVYQEPIITPDIVSTFEADITASGLNVRIEPMPMMGARAGVEWLLPTAIVAYLAKPYFESFLTEMGKDHYAIAKKAFVNLQNRIVAKFGDRLRVYASSGKVRSDSNKFSPVFSVEAQSAVGHRFKLLIQTEIKPEEFELAIEEFLSAVSEHEKIEDLVSQCRRVLGNKPLLPLILVAYNCESGQLEIVNPFPRQP